jgi:hypothetical protein
LEILLKENVSLPAHWSIIQVLSRFGSEAVLPDLAVGIMQAVRSLRRPEEGIYQQLATMMNCVEENDG